MSRITGGTFKGLPLVIPPHLRATEAKVRQALFNILGPSIAGARVLDAFAGSGAVGCEALSRGAAFVACVESDGQAVVSIRDNLARLGAGLPAGAWRVLQMDLARGLRELADSEAPFDIVVFDPPYGGEAAKKALNALAGYAMLARTGVAVVEHARRTVLPTSLPPLRQAKQHRYGDTVLSFYRPASGPPSTHPDRS
jgi:16S rRNA (guanine966-N2)-methyltransferase